MFTVQLKSLKLRQWFYQHALELLRTADNRAGAASSFKDNINKVQRAYDEAKKDNDFIYHERVPDIKSLPSIGKAAIAKPIALGETLSNNFKGMNIYFVLVY